MAKKQPQRPQPLAWRTCEDGPCSLNDLDLDSVPAAQGVYIIWLDGPISFVVYVGMVSSPNRTFADRFREHRREESIQRWQEDRVSELRVTCAVVSDLGDVAGMERFLIDELEPCENDVTPPATPIPVTLPPFLPD